MYIMYVLCVSMYVCMHVFKCMYFIYCLFVGIFEYVRTKYLTLLVLYLQIVYIRAYLLTEALLIFCKI